MVFGFRCLDYALSRAKPVCPSHRRAIHRLPAEVRKRFFGPYWGNWRCVKWAYGRRIYYRRSIGGYGAARLFLVALMPRHGSHTQRIPVKYHADSTAWGGGFEVTTTTVAGSELTTTGLAGIVYSLTSIGPVGERTGVFSTTATCFGLQQLVARNVPMPANRSGRICLFMPQITTFGSQGCSGKLPSGKTMDSRMSLYWLSFYRTSSGSSRCYDERSFGFFPLPPSLTVRW